MRKMMLTLTTVGLLAVPTGMALAQADAPEPAGPVPTCVDPIQARDRDRDRTDQTAPGALDQERTQQRTRTQSHDGTCDADCDGDQIRTQEHLRLQEQTRLSDGTGDGAMYRHAQMNDGEHG
jgi:hypothetical protein